MDGKKLCGHRLRVEMSCDGNPQGARNFKCMCYLCKRHREEQSKSAVDQAESRKSIDQMEVIIQLKEELERTRAKLMAMEQKEKDNEIIRLSYQYEADEMGLQAVALPISHSQSQSPSRSRSNSTTSTLDRSLDRSLDGGTPRKDHRRRSRRCGTRQRSVPRLSFSRSRSRSGTRGRDRDRDESELQSRRRRQGGTDPQRRRSWSREVDTFLATCRQSSKSQSESSKSMSPPSSKSPTPSSSIEEQANKSHVNSHSKKSNHDAPTGASRSYRAFSRSRCGELGSGNASSANTSGEWWAVGPVDRDYRALQTMLDTLVDFGVIDKENKSGESVKIKKEVVVEELEPGEIRDDDDESQAWPQRLFI